MQLEKNINKLFERLPFFSVKIPVLRAHTGQYIKGEPFDYIVIKDGITYCFDAKECKQDALYSRQIKEHQFNELLKAEKNGAKVFFLIWFVKTNTLKFIHPQTIIDNNKATLESVDVSNDLIQIFNLRK